jgi:hypothetical protein
LNNNRGNNNRRRGRGNRQQGSGQQLNRIDSRARGNAPQLLEKYRKLAHDAHLNGDRVQAEYYLQFADHYFRVLADARSRQEEQRNRPQGERWQEGAEDGDENGEFAGDSDFPSFDSPGFQRPHRQAQDDRPRDDRPRDDRPRDDRPRQPRRDTEDRFAEVEPARDDSDAEAMDEGMTTNPYEPVENPFVRENRGPRQGLRPRRDDRRPRREEAEADGPLGLDPASLPPAIATSRDEADEAEAKPKRGRPRKKPAGGEAGETLESVS